MQDLVRYSPSSVSQNIPNISAAENAIYKNQRLRNRTKAFQPQLSLPSGIGIRRGSNISTFSDKEIPMSPYVSEPNLSQAFKHAKLQKLWAIDIFKSTIKF